MCLKPAHFASLTSGNVNIGDGRCAARPDFTSGRKAQRPDEGWFILTNFQDLESAVLAYKKRFGIEEMFRDFKRGGYNLEGTNVTGERLVVIVLLIAIAYTTATVQGRKMKRMGIQKYIGRVKEARRTERRHSSFYIGLYGQNWVNFVDQCADAVAELMRLARNKSKYYQKGLRAMELIRSAL